MEQANHAGFVPTSPLVIATRGAIDEAWHPFSVAWAEGGSVTLWGSDVVTPFRSASKPFQAEAALSCLAPADAAAIVAEPAWLAIAASSHSGTAEHVAVVDALRARVAVKIDELYCGTHRPVDTDAADALLRAGVAADPRHNNCSGKHTLMAAATAALGADRDYRPVDHPLQLRVRALLERLAEDRSQTATDGCGVPTFALALSAIARCWRALAVAMADDGASTRGRIGAAMAARPDLTSGPGRLDLALVRAAKLPIAVKIGAQGVFCVALPHRRAGVAWKVHSGSSEALPAAVTAVLARQAPEVLPAVPPDWRLLEIRNVVEARVGGYRVQGEPSAV